MKEKIFSINDLKNIGQILKEKREKIGMTKYELVKRAGKPLTIPHVSRYESGANTSVATLVKVMEILYN